jgi:hypothetical protein
MHLDEELHIAELHEAAAPLAILRILARLRPPSRLRVLECVRLVVAADASVAGIIDRLTENHHPAVKEPES